MTTIVEQRRARAQYIGAGVLAVIVVVALTPIAGIVVVLLGLPVLAAAGVLVPLGVLYGLVAQGLLAARRHRARQDVAADTGRLDAETLRAAGFRFGLQVTERRLAIALLAILPLLVASVSVDLALGPAPSQSSPSALLQSYSLVLTLGLVIAVLAAIPLAAVISTRRLLSRPLLIGEAHALATSTGGHRRIRSTRLLTWIAHGIYFVGAVPLVVMLPSVLGF